MWRRDLTALKTFPDFGKPGGDRPVTPPPFPDTPPSLSSSPSFLWVRGGRGREERVYREHSDSKQNTLRSPISAQRVCSHCGTHMSQLCSYHNFDVMKPQLFPGRDDEGNKQRQAQSQTTTSRAMSGTRDFSFNISINTLNKDSQSS